MTTPKYEYRVSWQRAGWDQHQHRLYQSKGAAHNLIERLRGDDPQYAHLTPLISVKLEQRTVSDWERLS